MRQRKSNMELLRIMSIFMIVIFHCAYKSSFNFSPGFNINKLVIKIFWMFGEAGVNLFMLISGYFMINHHFKWKKLFYLLAEVQFYNWCIIFVANKLGIYILNGWRDTLFSFFPVTLTRYWFITAYIIVYILSPYLNIFIRALEQKTYQNFLFTIFILYCAIPSFFGFFFNTTETMLFYNRMIWLMIMYFFGAYIQKHGISFIQSQKDAIKMIMFSFSLLVSSILIIEHFSAFFAIIGTKESAFFWQPNTILMLFFSISIFELFLHIKPFYNSIINVIASTTLGIYLLHDGILASWLWERVFRCADYQDSLFLVFCVFKATIIIFFVGAIIDLIRQICGKYLFNKILILYSIVKNGL